MMGLGGVVASLFVRLGADTRPFKAGMRSAEIDLKRSTAGMNNTARSFSRMQTMYYAAAGAALLMFVKKSIDASIDLNTSMANVGTLIPGNIARLRELRGEVQRLAIATGKSSKDLADGLYHVISAFQDSADTVERLEIVAKAATAGVSSTKESLDLLSAVTKGYGDTTAEAVEHAADLAFYAVKMGQTTFPELAASMRLVIPLAAALNVQQEELFASYAALTGVTGNTANVTTQLASIMRGFMKPTTDMSKAIDKLGYSSVQTMIAHKGLVGALRDVIATTDGSAEEIAKLFERARGLPALFNLSGEGAENFDMKLRGAATASGIMTQALKEQTDGINQLGFSMKQLGEIQSTVWQKVGEGIAVAFSYTPAGLVLKAVKDHQEAANELERAAKRAKATPDIMAGGMFDWTPQQEREYAAYQRALKESAAILKEILATASHIDRLDVLSIKPQSRGKSESLEYDMWNVKKEYEQVPELILRSKSVMQEFHAEAAMVADLIAYDLVGAFVAAARAGENWLSTMLDYLIRIAQQMASMWLWDKIYNWYHEYNSTAKNLGYDTGLGVTPPSLGASPNITVIDQRVAGSPPLSITQSGDSIQIVVQDIMKDALASGTFDDTMRNTYGVSRSVVVR